MIQDNGDGTVTYKGLPLAALTALRYAGTIAQAVDDYLLMERKARAWDAVRSSLLGEPEMARHMDRVLEAQRGVVHPAQDSSAR